MMFKILNVSFMLFYRIEAAEGAGVSAFIRFRVLLPRIKAVFSRF